ncbi:YbbR-like domain-containing protein [Desertivirga xinjiangensis]|uniref:YbbR-like domain-containing protein n=1 Tax=Desertivirga xinjiangensis TaxID=539206 RepID=UPI00210E19FF|nr:YbbR-like domain-containing protein [Pedobacter xinjiangensis]
MSVFLTSLIIAIIAWLFFALSNRYEYKMDIRVNYINPPVHKAYHPLHDDTLALSIEGTGWQLFFSRLRISLTTINVSLKELEHKKYITLSSQVNELNRQLESGQRIIRVFPDTLFFDFSERVTKKVPVKLLYQFTFKRSFGISGPMKIVPDSIMIAGAAADLKNIKYWQTKNLVLSDISSPISTKVGFDALSSNIDIVPQEVKVEVPVDEFTEKVIDLPVSITNNKNKNIRIVPEKIKVTVLTALSNYAKVEKDSFAVSVNFNDWIKRKYTQLPVVFTKFPAYSKLVKAEPQIVDFIIQE